jgi:hypothetical protein
MLRGAALLRDYRHIYYICALFKFPSSIGIFGKLRATQRNKPYGAIATEVAVFGVVEEPGNCCATQRNSPSQ